MSASQRWGFWLVVGASALLLTGWVAATVGRNQPLMVTPAEAWVLSAGPCFVGSLVLLLMSWRSHDLRAVLRGLLFVWVGWGAFMLPVVTGVTLASGIAAAVVGGGLIAYGMTRIWRTRTARPATPSAS